VRKRPNCRLSMMRKRPRAAARVRSEDVIQARLLFFGGDLFGGGPCCGIVEESHT
jgi:hypothetical protein